MALSASLAAPDGKLWLGTTEVESFTMRRSGLAQFDGKSFALHLAGVPVAKIKLAPDQSIWLANPIGYSDTGGASYFDGHQFATVRQGLAGGLVQDLDFAPDGSIWFANWNDGVTRYDPKATDSDGKGFTIFSPSQVHLTNQIGSILCARNGEVWIGSIGQGASHYDGKHFSRVGTAQGFAASEVRTMLQESNGLIWFATEIGMFRFDGRQFEHFERGKDRLLSTDVLKYFPRLARRALVWDSCGMFSRFDG